MALLGASCGHGGIGHARVESPDIVLLDLSIPAPGGIETTQRIKREVPSAGIIALAVEEDEDQLFAGSHHRA